MRHLLPLLLLAAPALAQWGRDIDSGMGEQLISSVRGDLAAIVAAAPSERPALIDAVVKKHGSTRIEALKRFRNPELKALFYALLDHHDWHVQHRALFALEYYGDAALIDRAWPLLSHPNRRLREKAAITCIRLWDGRPAPGDVGKLIAREEDFHVRACLSALKKRIHGNLKPTRVFIETPRKETDGLLLVPFVSGMKASGEPNARTGKGRASPSPRWVHPLLGQGEEEVAGVSLQPFANLRQGGRVFHTGLDVGACLDGAGLYAAADGVVRLIHTGSDMGTLIVVEHALPRRATVNAVYMHAGDTVFVRPAERVAAGQLLATMGLGFSAENGGHFAHLHYGLYPGAFDLAHNYGYKPVKEGLADWIDPKPFLDHWVARTAPLLPHLRPLDRAVAGAAKEAGAGRYREAHAIARKVRDRAEPGSVTHVDAVYLMGMIEEVPSAGLRRARRLRKQGFPRDAAAQLKELRRRTRGLPGAERVTEALAEWEADDLFGKALEGEGRLDAARRRAARSDAIKAHAIFAKLLEDYGDTCLRPRIEAALR